MVVPPAEAERNAASAGLDQPPRGKELVIPIRTRIGDCAAGPAAVAIAEFVGLLAYVQRLHQTVRSQEVEGAGGDAVELADDAGFVHLATVAVHRREQLAAVAETV